MPLVTDQATFTRYADGSVRIVSAGGVDPSLTPDEGDALIEYLNATEKARSKVYADVVSSVKASLASEDKAAADLAHATAHTVAAANTEIVLAHKETAEEKAGDEVAAHKPAKAHSKAKPKTATVTSSTVTVGPDAKALNEAQAALEASDARVRAEAAKAKTPTA